MVTYISFDNNNRTKHWNARTIICFPMKRTERAKLINSAFTQWSILDDRCFIGLAKWPEILDHMHCYFPSSFWSLMHANFNLKLTRRRKHSKDVTVSDPIPNLNTANINLTRHAYFSSNSFVCKSNLASLKMREN